MEEKDADLWWDVVLNIVQKDIKKVCRKYERNERLYEHKIFHMEKNYVTIWVWAFSSISKTKL